MKFSIAIAAVALVTQSADASPWVRLSDAELGEVRGGAPVISTGMHLRSLSENQLVADAQGADRISWLILDNWFATTGSQLIAANVLRSVDR